jgi:hypothetical protein
MSSREAFAKGVQRLATLENSASQPGDARSKPDESDCRRRWVHVVREANLSGVNELRLLGDANPRE